jgi:hypothetical protein
VVTRGRGAMLTQHSQGIVERFECCGQCSGTMFMSFVCPYVRLLHGVNNTQLMVLAPIRSR